MEKQRNSQVDGEAREGEGRARSRRRAWRWARGMAVVVCAWVAFHFALGIPVGHSDKEEATVGRITYSGFPIPWRETAPGDSISSALENARWWAWPINLAFWTLGSCWVWRVKSLRGMGICLAVAEAPVLLFTPWWHF